MSYELPQLVVGALHRPQRTLRRAGGKSFNVARVLAGLGAEPVVVGPVGGPGGAWLVAEAEREGIAFAALPIEGYQTRTCVSLCPVGDPAHPTEVNEPAPELGQAGWRELTAAVGAGSFPLSVLSGSLPPDASVAQLAELVAAARHDRDGATSRLIIDLHGEVAARWLATPGALAYTDVIKVNEAEAAQLVGRPLVPADPEPLRTALARAELLRRSSGAGAAIVTLGPHGAVLAADSARLHVVAGPMGLYPVGSGDAFLAGLALSLARLTPQVVPTAATWVQALGLASAAGSDNAQRWGAGSVEPSAVSELAAAMSVREV